MGAPMLNGRLWRFGLVVLMAIGSMVIGFGANWAARLMSVPSTYCLEQGEPQNGTYILQPNRSGCQRGQVCIFLKSHIVSQELRATDCGPQRSSG